MMRGNALNLKTHILDRMEQAAPFGAWTPVDFLDLGPREAIDQALHRLARGKQIRRITRGLYDKPRANSLTGKLTNPDPRAVIDALSRRDQTRMLIDGITAANDLGLTDVVPAHIVVHTDARLKSFELGNLVIDFWKPAPSKLYWAGRRQCASYKRCIGSRTCCRRMASACARDEHTVHMALRILGSSAKCVQKILS